MKMKSKYFKVLSVFLLFFMFSNYVNATLMVANDFVNSGTTYGTSTSSWITFTHTFDTSLGKIESATIGLTYSGVLDQNLSVMATWVADNSAASVTFDPVFLGFLFAGNFASDNKYSLFNLPVPALDTLGLFGGIAFSFIGDKNSQPQGNWTLHSSNLETTYSVSEPPMLFLFLMISLLLVTRQKKLTLKTYIKNVA